MRLFVVMPALTEVEMIQMFRTGSNTDTHSSTSELNDYRWGRAERKIFHLSLSRVLMGDLPRRFPVEVIDWVYADRLCRRVASQIKEDDIDPDLIVGITRGGWFPARCLADRLDVEELFSLLVDNYTGDADNRIRVRDTVDPSLLRDRHVLLVDDSIDTGRTMNAAVEALREHDPASLDIAVLQVFEPPAEAPVDYVATTYDEWRFVVNPWEFVENMIDMMNGVLFKADPGVVTVTDIYALLEEYHEVRRSDLEMVRPEGIRDVLDELQDRGIVVERGEGLELSDWGRERYRNL